MSSVYTPCPGWYCGRRVLDAAANVLSECGSCPRGYRRNETTHVCELCVDTPTFYDWLYLGYVVLSILVLHWFFVDMVAMRRSFSKEVIALHATALLEVCGASAMALLLTRPYGTFAVEGCGVRSLSDWYTLIYNPTPDYERRIHCTQEAVYPLYTIVFVFYGYCLLLMLLIRPWICKRFLPRQSKMSVYAAMYFIPILTVVHALIGGLLYYAYPYLIVIVSVVSCAAHFSKKMDQSIASLIVTTVVDPRNVVILIGHWALHAYGLIAITQLTDPYLHGALVLLVPLPALFYVVTSKFTDPSKFLL